MVTEARPKFHGRRQAVSIEQVAPGAGGKSVEVVEVAPQVRVLSNPAPPRRPPRPIVETGHRVRGRPPVHNVPVLGEIVDKDPVSIDEVSEL